jgi:hypothetical protein
LSKASFIKLIYYCGGIFSEDEGLCLLKGAFLGFSHTHAIEDVDHEPVISIAHHPDVGHMHAWHELVIPPLVWERTSLGEDIPAAHCA